MALSRLNPFKDFKVTNHTPMNFIIFTDPIGANSLAQTYTDVNVLLLHNGKHPWEVSRDILSNPTATRPHAFNARYQHKALGAYKLAHECRLAGFTVQVVDNTSAMDVETLKRVVDKYVGEETLAMGKSNTFSVKMPWTLNALPIEYPFVPLDGATDLDKLFNPFPGAKDHGFLPHGKELDDEFVNYVKGINPNVKFITGGAFTREDAEYSNTDFINVGWGDVTLPELLTRLRDGTANELPVHTKHPYTLDTISKIEMEHSSMEFIQSDVVIQGEPLPLETARGCIFKCKFCNFGLLGKEKGSYFKSCENIKAEIEHNYYELGVTDYWIVEDTFNDDHEKIIRLHEIITNLPFKIQFTCYLRLDLLYANRNQPVPQHQLLLEMGLKHVEFGIETTNPESAKDIGKGLHPEIQFSFLRELRDKHGWEDMVLSSGFIVGLPSDTIESLAKMSKFLLSTNTVLDRIAIRPLRLDPVTLNPALDSRDSSEFSRNWQDYGYTLIGTNTGGSPNYINKNGLTLADCEKFCKNINIRSEGRLQSLFEVELKAKGLAFPTITALQFSPGEWDGSKKHQQRLTEMQRSKILHYIKTLLTQDINYET